VHEIPGQIVFLDSALNQTLSTIVEGEAKTKGIELGKKAGQAIISDRQNDGSAGDPISPVAGTNTPGVYQAVPPFDFVFAPFWTDLNPLVCRNRISFAHTTPFADKY
jgi:hypothetical protein